jgi:hypothetical protein
MLPSELKIGITKNPPPLSYFLGEPSEDNLIRDIEMAIGRNIILNINSFESQKRIIFVINEIIRHTLDHIIAYQQSIIGLRILNEFRHFILIKNRTMINFEFEVQLSFDGDIFESIKFSNN